MFISTRNDKERKPFSQAIFQGLAPDGGLYVPEKWISLSSALASLQEASFNEMAGEITFSLLKDEITRQEAQTIVDNAFFFEPKFFDISENLQIMELYHGPSCAFKDFGASFLASSMEFFLQEKDKPAIILTATSGDTGSAVAQAFHNKKNIEVVILYPSQRVSPLQEKQLTTLGGNITALEVKGNFDDCQKMVKEAFMDSSLNKKLRLTSANSINLGRLLPQSFYYLYARLKDGLENKPYRFCVPSGNFGNLTAGLYAWKWGLPVDKFIASTNRNDVVPQYLFTGEFNPQDSIPTYSNAMDVGNPSNFERMMHLFNNNWQSMRHILEGYAVTDHETLFLMNEFYERHNHFIDPHTAVGIHGAKRFLHGLPQSEWGKNTILSTANAAKFSEIVEKATGKLPEIPEQLKACITKPKKSVLIENTIENLNEFLLSHYQ